MSSVIDKIVLNEAITHAELELLNDKQKPYAYRLIYDHIPFDKYWVDVKITDANVADFADSPVFKEKILYIKNIQNLRDDELREFIENYPTNEWCVEYIRDNYLFMACNVIKSAISLYIKELYDLQTISQFPKCWRHICVLPKIIQSNIKSLETFTQYETDAIVYGRFITMYDTFAHKCSKGKRRDEKALAYIMREIIALCDYSNNLYQFKLSLLVKYYAIINDYESSAQLQLMLFNKVKTLGTFIGLIQCFSFQNKFMDLSQLMLDNLELCYTLSNWHQCELLIGAIIKVIPRCSIDFQEKIGLIFNNHIRKFIAQAQKRTVYYNAFVIDSECIVCCANTDTILKCVSCNKATCCMKCAQHINLKKCMLCNYNLR
jgi:hypothetical protein